MRQKIFLILWLIALCVSSQTIKINDVPDWDKIPVKVIHRMYQDHRGFIWYGTFGGLFRYDGYAIKAYRSDFKTPDVFSSNYITNIREDKDVLFLLKKRVSDNIGDLVPPVAVFWYRRFTLSDFS